MTVVKIGFSYTKSQTKNPEKWVPMYMLKLSMFPVCTIVVNPQYNNPKDQRQKVSKILC